MEFHKLGLMGFRNPLNIQSVHSVHSLCVFQSTCKLAVFYLFITHLSNHLLLYLLVYSLLPPARIFFVAVLFLTILSVLSTVLSINMCGLSEGVHAQN